jgi:hypothetical protein
MQIASLSSCVALILYVLITNYWAFLFCSARARPLTPQVDFHDEAKTVEYGIFISVNNSSNTPYTSAKIL